MRSSPIFGYGDMKCAARKSGIVTVRFDSTMMIRHSDEVRCLHSDHASKLPLEKISLKLL